MTKKQIEEKFDEIKDCMDLAVKLIYQKDKEITKLKETNQNLNRYIDHLECKLGGE